MKALALGAALLVGLAGCGDDPVSTDPQDPTGSWSYAATDLVGGGFACVIRDVSLTLSAGAASLSGTTQGGTLTCTVGDTASEPVPLGAGTVTGTVSGSAVSFDVRQGANEAQNQGQLSASTLSGTIAARFDFGPQFGVVELAGSFRADRR